MPLIDVLEKIRNLRYLIENPAGDVSRVLESELVAVEEALRVHHRDVERLGRELEKERSARQKAEAAREESDKRFDEMLCHITEVYFQLDDQGRFRYVSPVVEQALGYSSGEILGRTLVSLSLDDDVSKIQRRLDRAWQGKEGPTEAMYRLVQKDGMLRHFRISCGISEEEGARSLAGLLTDVSELYWAEAIILVIQERFHRLFHSSPVGLIEVDYSEIRRYFDELHQAGVTDLQDYFQKDPEAVCRLAGEGPVKQANPAALEIFEAQRKDQVVFNPFEVCEADRMVDFSRGLLSLFIDGASPELEGVVTTTMGLARPVLLKWLVVRGHEEELDRVIVAVVDIAERKKVEEANIRAMEAAEAASRAKSQFLANVTHEVRTPMNGLLGMIELALDTDLTPQQEEYLHLAKLSAQSLLTLINDILDLSKIEAGKFDLDLKPFNLCEAMADTLDTLAVSAHEKGLELVLDIQPDVPLTVVGDVLRLRQVATNLCGNAIKFTPQGDVILRINNRGEEDGGFRLDFEVRDTGIGIPQDKQDMIFSAFSQVDASTSRRYGGTGLGLAISSELVKMMDGEIRVESEPGRGSVFHFNAHFRFPENLPVVEPRIFNHEPVLVVDDNTAHRNVLTRTLSHWGLKPTPLDSGREALEELERAAGSNQPYALVLLDSHMPQWDGFETARLIKKHDRIKDTLLIMLTPIGRRGDVERCRTLGAAGRISKPIRPAVLKKTLARLLKGTEASHHLDTAVSPESIVSPGALKILMAEDNVVLQKLQSTVLTQWGHKVQIVDNGREAVAAYKENGPYDLLLLDVQMPEMDGLEATRIIRKHEKKTGARIPIIALTGRAMKGDREDCLEAGMDGIILKPFSVEDLKTALNSVIDQSGEIPMPSMPDQHSTAAADPFDPQAFLRLVGQDETLAASMIDTFLNDLPQQMARIKTALNRSDPQSLMQTAHALKGAIRLFTAPAATNAAKDLEDMGKTNDLGRAQEAWERLDREVERLTSALQRYAQGLP